MFYNRIYKKQTEQQVVGHHEFAKTKVDLITFFSSSSSEGMDPCCVCSII